MQSIKWMRSSIGCSKLWQKIENHTIPHPLFFKSYDEDCFYNLQEKQEGWWLYVCDKEDDMLITTPVYIPNLKDEEEVSVGSSQSRGSNNVFVQRCSWLQ